MTPSMTRRRALLGLAGLLPLGWSGRALAGDSFFDQATDLIGDFLGGGGLSDGEIAAGLREALKVGSRRVVAQVGRRDGFNADPKIHIPLPDSLRS